MPTAAIIGGGLATLSQRPVASKHPDVRYLHIPEDGTFDEEQFTDWIGQAAKLRGEELF